MPTLLDLAHFSNAVYYGPEDNYELPEGWKEYGPRSDPEWDKSLAFCAQAYRNDKNGEVAIAFRGTVPTRPSNLISDALLTARVTHRGEEYAVVYAVQVIQKLMQEYGVDGLSAITITGHSLGGNLAQAVSACFQNNGTLPFSKESLFVQAGKYLLQNPVAVSLIQTVEAYFRDHKDQLPDLPSVTFQAPGVAHVYIAEGRRGEDYDGVHLFNEGDVVRSAGSVNIGVPSMLRITNRPVFQKVASVASIESSSGSDTESSDELSSDIEMTDEVELVRTPSNASNRAAWYASLPSITDLSTSIVSTGSSVVGAVGSAAQTVVTAYPAHLMSLTINVLNAQPGIGNLTPQQYKLFMSQPTQLDLLAALTPTQYDLIPYHKSILLQALIDNKLSDPNVSMVMDTLKRVKVLDADDVVLRKLGRMRLLAWQEPWLQATGKMSAMEPRQFEILGQVRETIKGHREELTDLRKGLEAWLDNNSRRMIEMQREDSGNRTADSGDSTSSVLKAENEKLSEAIDSIYKEAIHEVKVIAKSLEKLVESIDHDVDMDRDMDTDSQLTNEDENARASQMAQLRSEQQSIRSEQEALTNAHATFRSRRHKRGRSSTQTSQDFIGLGTNEWGQQKIRSEQIKLLKKMAFSNSTWTPTAAMAIQPLLKEMAETRNELIETLTKLDQEARSKLDDLNKVLVEVETAARSSSLTEKELNIALEMLDSSANAIKDANADCVHISETILSDLRIVSNGLDEAHKSISQGKARSWIPGIVLQYLSSESTAKEKTLEILSGEHGKIENELDDQEMIRASLQLQHEHIDSMLADHVKVIDSIRSQLRQEQPSGALALESRDSDPAMQTQSSSAALLPSRPSSQSSAPTQSAGRKRPHSDGINLSKHQSDTLDRKLGKGRWVISTGDGRSVNDRPIVIEPEGCTKDTLESAFFVLKAASERNGIKVPASVAVVKADRIPDEHKADVAAGRPVKFTIGKGAVLKKTRHN